MRLEGRRSPSCRTRGRVRSADRGAPAASYPRVRGRAVVTRRIERLRGALAPRYELLEELGRGATSTVYLATDHRFQRLVAMKVLREELADGTSAARFAQEIRIAAQLQHPNIVPLYDSGQVLGLPYFVMPHIEGETLRARLRRDRRLDLDEALAITDAIGRALDYAHRHAIAHRDIKPDNVLLHLGVPLVTDFGIAVALGRSGAGGRAPVGTPEYMSPEQAGGWVELDGRTDLYSLACLLYEMLSGRPPFTGSQQAVIAQHLAVEALPLTALRPDAPSAVSRAVARALSKAPADRFTSAAEFVSALYDGRTRRLAPTITTAVLPFVNVSGDPTIDTLSHGVTEAVARALTTVRGLNVSAHTHALALDGRAIHLSELARRLDADLLLLGSVREARATVRIAAHLIHAADACYQWSGRFDRPSALGFTLEDEVASEIAECVRVALLPIRSRQAFTPCWLALTDDASAPRTGPRWGGIGRTAR